MMASLRLYVGTGVMVLTICTRAAAAETTFRLPSEVVRPTSTFDSKASNARDPFFPNSTRSPYVQQNKVDTKEPNKQPEVKLILKGILSGAGGRLALINNKTLSEGESAAVRVPGGEIRIQCVKINERTVTVSVEGRNEQMELRLQEK